MKTRNRNKVKLKLNGPRIEVPLPVTVQVPVRGTVENDLEKLKARLLTTILDSTVELEANPALHHAASEAASAAWFTPFPLLFFPTLLEEKARKARLQVKRQREIRERTEGLLEQAITE